jgi:hypothetical protein
MVGSMLLNPRLLGNADILRLLGRAEIDAVCLSR